MKTLLFTLTLAIACSLVMAQEKAPEAENDFYDAFSLKADTLHVLENDFAYDEHPFKLIQAFPPQHGEIDWNDSLIFYTPNMYFKGLDSIIYRILDTENMLMSELATVYLTVNNKSFDTLQLNNIHCRINACGTQFWDMESGTMFEVPANSGISAIYSQSLWMGAHDQDNELHVAADINSDGIDYFPGPVMDSIDYTTEYDINWNRVWMLYQTDIDYHRAHWQDAGYEMIENILDWPTSVNTELAPFYDIDGNGAYDPANGDFPLIKGDQAIYFIFNDHRGYHTQTYGQSIGAEIHAMYYAYDRPDDSTLNNTVFASYQVINKSDNNYHDYYIGFYNDFDIGCPTDDYLGTDTVLNSFYAYNNSQCDSSNLYPVNYGNYPPAASFTALNQNISSTMSYYSYNNQTYLYDYYWYCYNNLRAIWGDSTHLTIGNQGYGGNVPTMFMYTGDPVTGQGWLDVVVNNEIDDRRGLASTGPFTLNSGESIELDFALVFARDYSGGDLAHLNSVSLLKERIVKAKSFYDESLGEEELQYPQMEVEIYPNPFADFIWIKATNNSQNLTYSVYNILGKTMISGTVRNNHPTQINLEKLISGIYFIRIFDGKTFVTKKIIKQNH
nr:T9SS type A sorting domain-containing protein [Bacteroidota bacterium]